MKIEPIQQIWIRAESKAGEHRAALAPGHARELILKGFEVTIEASAHRVFSDEEYQRVGCRRVAAHSWRFLSENEKKKTLILGLKELDPLELSIGGAHCYFGHLYKEQAGAIQTLRAFQKGSGRLFDLEYLMDENQKRIAAFGFWAGYVGAALGVLAWAKKKKGENLGPAKPWKSRELLIRDVTQVLGDQNPSVVITGAKGRCGVGATQLIMDTVSSPHLQLWDLAETQRGGPFVELLEQDLLIHAVSNSKIMAPFLDQQSFQGSNPKLSMVVDVTCDLGNPTHLLPFIDRPTDLLSPVAIKMIGSTSVDYIAIDHLPTLLPRESSEDFSNHLFPFLLGFLDQEPKATSVFHRSLEIFDRTSENLL